ncbi:hypothetical protein BJ742DRAFT_824068 [Cladochytrium replicatum]|nr:hypothetical protein BJ742DRAFT_824068 [Cladochytrium replicatum]
MSILNLVHSIRGRIQQQFAPSLSVKRVSNHNNNSKSTGAPFLTARKDVNHQPSSSPLRFVPHVEAPSPAQKETRVRFASAPTVVAPAPVKQSSRPPSVNSLSEDEASSSDLERKSALRNNRRQKTKRRSKKHLGIPISRSPTPSTSPRVIETTHIPTSRSIASGFACTAGLTLRIDPSWSFADKLIQTKLFAYLVDTDDAALDSLDAELVGAVLNIGYGTPSVWEEVEERTRVQALEVAARIGRIVEQIIHQESKYDREEEG